MKLNSKYRTCCFWLFLIFVITFSSAEAGEITGVNANSPVITVSIGGMSGDILWLGCSVKKNGRLTDLAAKLISANGTYQFMKMGLDEWIVSLWRKKVENCGCSYCRKNGYHLEGQVSTTGWQRAPGAWGY